MGRPTVSTTATLTGKNATPFRTGVHSSLKPPLEVSNERSAGEPAIRELSTASSTEGVTSSLPNGVTSSSLKLPKNQPSFPLLALIVSGGHSQLALFKDHGDYKLIGQTQDDAVGEAFDKVAKIIGLPYPGGPSISISFSGLKTAALRTVQREVGKDFTFPSHELPGLVDDELRHNMAASFQHTAVKTLVDKTKQAFDDFQPKSVIIAGGVAANQELRRQLRQALPIDIEYAPIQLCTDNAAMIGALGFYRAQLDSPADPYDLEVQPSLSM
ncbi:hypothetical protein CR969_00735 [Candidatus Saccharibacteria bacterium]|nr:MAG: hypothetical protein CR969_00735 [Candidatus Saccharibacteria bacterium]